MTSKTVWIINQYATTPDLGYGGRSFYIGRNLARKGHKVTIIAGSANHLLRKSPSAPNLFNRQAVDGMDFVWVRLADYAGARSVQRILNWFRFAFALTHVHRFLQEKPDIIICSSPSLISWLGAEWQGWRNHARTIFEVRDIWPLTLRELGGFHRLHPFILFLQWVERRAYRKADVVVSNLPHADDHMVSCGMNRNKFLWLPNGVDVGEFSSGRTVPDAVQTAVPADKFVVGYAGTLGEANALDTLIEAAALLADDLGIHFVLVGSGRMKEKLVQQAQNALLSNVSFVDSIDKQDIPSTLSSFDACYIGARSSPIYRFGVAMNKIPEYLMSARPIIYAIDSGPYRPVLQAQCGIEVPPDDPQMLANNIKILSRMDAADRKAMGARARDFALANFDYEKIAEALEAKFRLSS